MRPARCRRPKTGSTLRSRRARSPMSRRRAEAVPVVPHAAASIHISKRNTMSKTPKWPRGRLFAAALAASAALATGAGTVAMAVPQAAAPAPASTAKAPPVPLLWKVSDEDNALYLLGSFHLLTPEDYPLSRDVDMALADAEKLLFEIAPEELASPQLGLKMAQAAMRTDGSTLDAQLGP